MEKINKDLPEFNDIKIEIKEEEKNSNLLNKKKLFVIERNIGY